MEPQACKGHVQNSARLEALRNHTDHNSQKKKLLGFVWLMIQIGTIHYTVKVVIVQ